MRNILVILFTVTLLCAFKKPENIRWHSLKEGLEAAKSENKPVLLFLYVSWCDKCQRMDKKVFSNTEVQPLIEQNFIPVKLNPEVDSAIVRSDELLDRKIYLTDMGSGKFGMGVPTTVLYNVFNKDHVAMHGLVDPEELKEKMAKFLKKTGKAK
jgi:thioredoxin-related protein